MAIIRSGEEIASQHARGSQIISAAVAERLADEIARSLSGKCFNHRFPKQRLTTSTADGIETTGSQLLTMLEELPGTEAVFKSDAAADDFERRLPERLITGGSVENPRCTGADRRRISRLAECDLRDHRREPLDLLRACRELGTSPRTLQTGFLHSFGISIKSYLQALHFQGARRDLTTADPAESSVTAVALDWGFRHLGHFAIKYKQWCGESPGVSLNAVIRTHPPDIFQIRENHPKRGGSL